MPRSAAKFLGPLAGLLLAFHGYFALRGFAQAWREGADWRAAAEIGPALLAVLFVSLVGRIVLAWLPAGPLGAHTPRDLPTTWAASYLLGLTAVHAERIVFPQGSGVGYGFLLAAPWILLGVARVLTLPAAMVPRHEPRHERPGLGALALRTLAVVWIGAVIVLELHLPAEYLRQEFRVPADPGGSLLGPFGLDGAAWFPLTTPAWFALWILVGHGLGQARRMPAGSALFVVVGLLTRPYLSPPWLLPEVCFGTGALFLIGWLRRADQRACWLSAIGFASCALAGEPTLALAGLLTLVIASWPEQRRRAVTVAGLCALILGLTGFLGLRQYAWFQGWVPWSPARGDITGLIRSAFRPSDWGAVWFLFAGTLVVGVLVRLRSRVIEREQLAVLLLFVLGCLALFPLVWSWSDQTILARVFPVTLLLAGLVWIPEEEPS